ncbi:MAG: bacterioferritin-associated ferredoxin [Pseudomonadota bacterium]
MYVCICNAITDKQIRQAASKGATTVLELTNELGVAAGCGTCRQTAAEILSEHENRGRRFDPIVFNPLSA